MSDFHFAFGESALGVLDLRPSLEFLQAILDESQSIGLQTSHCPTVALSVAETVFIERALIDAIVISGDLATTGQRDDLSKACNFVTSPPIADFLAVDDEPTLYDAHQTIVIAPGNHDRFYNNFGVPRSNLFDEIFAVYWPDKFVNTSIIFDDEGDNHLCLISVDFSLHSALHADPLYHCFGQGVAYEKIVNKLVETTKSLRDEFPNAGIVWISHFPPTQSCSECTTDLKLNEYRAVLSAAEYCNISCILSGHIHKKHIFEIKDVKIYCAGSACAYSIGRRKSNWLHILDFQVEAGRVAVRSRDNYRYNIDGFLYEDSD